MVLEATIVCLDNSEWTRNGDYSPSRLEAQHDAVSLLCDAKTQANPESSVAIMTMGGRVEVLVSLTTDIGKILTATHGIKFRGETNFLSALQVGQLALKNRQNKSQQQRVVMFVGSPLKEDVDSFVRVAKKLKKNNIAVDVINFGEEPENTAKLDAFIAAIDNKQNSHLVNVPRGVLLSDALFSSPLFTSGGESGGVPGLSNPSSAFGGGLDPELEMALAASLEEERQRQMSSIATQSSTNENTNTTTTPSSSTSTTTSKPTETKPSSSDQGSGLDDEDMDLINAIAMSMEAEQKEKDNTNSNTNTSTTTTTTTTNINTTATVPTPSPQPKAQPKSQPRSYTTEDEEMEMAMHLSLQDHQNEVSKEAAKKEEPVKEEESQPSSIDDVMNDSDFLNSVLSSLPGVDPNDSQIQDVLSSFTQPEKKKEEEKKEEEKKDEK